MIAQIDNPGLARTGISRTHRRWLMIWGIILLAQVSGRWSPAGDAVTYLSLAKNLAMGHGLINCGSPRWIASPGYPILISPLFWINPTPWLWLSLFQWSMMVAFMLGVYRWAKRMAPEVAVLIAGAAAIHACTWAHVRSTTTEASFMAFSIWAINFLQTSLFPPEVSPGSFPRKFPPGSFSPEVPTGSSPEVSRKSPGSSPEDSSANISESSLTRSCGVGFCHRCSWPWRGLMIGSLLLAYAAFIRPAGLMIAAGAALLPLIQWRQGKRSFAKAFGVGCWIALPALLTVTGFYLHESFLARVVGGPTYAEGFVPQSTGVMGMLLEGVRMRISDFGRLTVPGMAKAYSSQGKWLHISMAVYLPLFMGLAWAWWKLVRKHLDIWLVAMPFYLALHVGYARFFDGTRFLTPLLPVVLLCLWQLLILVKGQRLHAMTAICILHIVIAMGIWIHHMPRIRKVHEQWPDARACAAQMQGKAGLTVGLGKLNHLVLQVAILLDRNVPRRWTRQQVQQVHPRWVIATASAKPPGGYFLTWKSPSGKFYLYEKLGSNVSDSVPTGAAP